MKHLIAILISAVCAAEEANFYAAKLPNGLQVLFSDAPCPVKHIEGKQIASKLSNGNLIYGCWKLVGSYVVAFWQVDEEKGIFKLTEWEKSSVRFLDKGAWEGYKNEGLDI